MDFWNFRLGPVVILWKFKWKFEYFNKTWMILTFPCSRRFTSPHISKKAILIINQNIRNHKTTSTIQSTTLFFFASWRRLACISIETPIFYVCFKIVFFHKCVSRNIIMHFLLRSFSLSSASLHEKKIKIFSTSNIGFCCFFS